MKEENKQKELSRVPRTLSESSNSKVLEVLFDAGGTVMSDIIIYVASSQMKDLFGDCWFSINDFCEAMGYERTKLQRKLTEKQLDFLFSNQHPVYITEQNGQKIEHPIENTFEAALYRLGTSNLTVTYAMNGKTQYKFIQILDNFEIKDDFSTKKRTKRNYNVHLSKDLMNTLFTEYNLLELKDYRKLPNRKGYRKFYLNLAKMIYLIKYKADHGQQPYFTTTVDRLADIFEGYDHETQTWNVGSRSEAEELLKKLDASREAMGEKWTTLDTEANFLDKNGTQLENTYDALNVERSNLEDIDPADAILELVWAQTCYNAALQVGTNVIPQSLMDYMK